MRQQSIVFIGIGVLLILIAACIIFSPMYRITYADEQLPTTFICIPAYPDLSQRVHTLERRILGVITLLEQDKPDVPKCVEYLRGVFKDE